jgi:hypothetical protein
VEWESGRKYKADDSLKSFLFTLKNPHNISARRFALKTGEKNHAIVCHSERGPCFYNSIYVFDNCNRHDNSNISLGDAYINDTGLDVGYVLTGWEYFQVAEIEVFEIAA